MRIEHRPFSGEKGGVPAMRFQSFLACAMENYVAYRHASGRTSTSYVKNIIHFDRYCAREYPQTKELEQEIVDQWCKQRQTECTNSCISRIYPIISFLRYAKKRGFVDVAIPVVPKLSPRTYMPHPFTENELVAFFNTCDTLHTRNGINGDIRKITVPVFFRLLYSSGMRTTEVRLLRNEDVNLENGVVNIKFSKGFNQHFIVLHDSMLELMKVYDSAISKLVPDRTYFFPIDANKGFSDRWITYFFRKLWSQSSKAYATAYELRHNYAIENINNWVGEGLGEHMKLLALSKSMGHSDMESTKYYYSLVPRLSDIMSRVTNDTFNEIIPNIINDEESK